jgi:hypothetical protein
MKFMAGQRVRVNGWKGTGVIEEVDHTMHEGLWLHVRLTTGQFLIVQAHNVKVID